MARYIDLDELIKKVRQIEPPHNFQLERRDIVDYIYASWGLLKHFYLDEAHKIGLTVQENSKTETDAHPDA